MNKENPKIRTDLEFVPGEYEGQQIIIVRDPLGFMPEPKVLSPDLLHLISLLNGTYSIKDLQLELARLQGGLLVDKRQIEDALSKLDNMYMLDNQSNGFGLPLQR